MRKFGKIKAYKSGGGVPLGTRGAIRATSVTGDIRDWTAKLFGYVPKKIRKMLDKYSNNVMENIVIRRAPVQKYIRTLLNFTSNDELDRFLSNKSYDDIFHLSITFQAGDKIHRLEKNEVVSWTDEFRPREDEQEYPLGVQPKFLTIGEVVSQTESRIGKEAMWGYSAFKNNCQEFIKQLLITMGLYSPDVSKWVYQDVENLSESMNELTKTTSDVATNIAGTISTITDYLGFKRGGVVVNQNEPTQVL